MVTVFDMSGGELVQVSAEEIREASLVPMVMPGYDTAECVGGSEHPRQDYPQLALQLVEITR